MCKEHKMGFIAMKAVSGGLCGSAKAAFAYQQQFDNVVPSACGVQRQEELDESLFYEQTLPTLDDELMAVISKRNALSLPEELSRPAVVACLVPVGIQIPTVARLHLLCTRSPYQKLYYG